MAIAGDEDEFGERVPAEELALADDDERLPWLEADEDFDEGGVDTGRLVLRHHGETVCDVPLAPLFDDAPLYDRPWVQPAVQPKLDHKDIPAPDSWVDRAFRSLSPSLRRR